MEKLRTTIAYVACAALMVVFAACGRSGSGSADKKELVVSSTAMDGAPVSILVRPYLQLSPDIDSASVETAAVELRMISCIPDAGCSQAPFSHKRSTRGRCQICHNFSATLADDSLPFEIDDFFVDRDVEPVTGSVTWDEAARRVSFVPDQPLARGAAYALTVSGLRDPSGTSLAALTASFTTLTNPARRLVRYNNDGSVAAYDVYDSDARGRIVRVTRYDGAGQDGEWMSADDRIAQYADDSYGEGDLRTRRVTYGAAGADGQWHTSDDTVRYNYAYMVEGGRLVRFTIHDGAGTDGAWFTEDDAIAEYRAFSYDERGKIVRIGSFVGSGPDGVWFTTDDESPQGIFEIQTDTIGRDVRQFYYSDAGRDGQWGTLDDTIKERRDIAYDSSGSEETVIAYRPGDDGAWFTGDDTVSSYSVATFDSRGFILSSRRVSEPGSDAVWFTNDDIDNSHTIYTYDGALYPVRVDSFALVPWNSPPPPALVAYSETKFNSHRQRQREIRFNGAGPDGQWRTGDDSPESSTDYQYDEAGNRTSSFATSGAAADNVWWTADDQKAWELTYATDR